MTLDLYMDAERGVDWSNFTAAFSFDWSGAKYWNITQQWCTLAFPWPGGS